MSPPAGRDFEELAIEAETARRSGDDGRAHELYRQASAEEVQAFGTLANSKQ
jgi:hypothetical protein